MILKFTTPCFVKVANTEEINEITDKLLKMGYLLGQHNYDPLDNMIVTYPDIGNTFCIGSDGYYDEVDFKDRIDCGKNIFLSLAGMREDTDKDQWFIVTTTAVLFKKLKGAVETFDNKKCQTAGSLFKVISPKDIKCTFIGGSQGIFRHATTEEIVEHFQSKEK